MPITITMVDFTTTNVVVWFSDYSLWSSRFVTKPITFLADMTPAERNRWAIVEHGTAVEWNATGARLTLAQMDKY
ncbi:hypothetical protein [Hymenobacter crusticola]|uniref:DUF2442 domain-containing protein n=1 Tax=Hymenobacter crusticola TaxID=1770526 RepID=A0A243W4N3_9BACT|nr:hypothetical protein [Hymenobacter crusticola]OUJ64820.1 hypothetical protein BXP70_29290 [Hymenobacter crusticola]